MLYIYLCVILYVNVYLYLSVCVSVCGKRLVAINVSKYVVLEAGSNRETFGCGGRCFTPTPPNLLIKEGFWLKMER